MPMKVFLNLRSYCVPFLVMKFLKSLLVFELTGLIALMAAPPKSDTFKSFFEGAFKVGSATKHPTKHPARDGL